jgi:hypothetical protein
MKKYLLILLFSFLIFAPCRAIDLFDYQFKTVSLLSLENNTNDFYDFSKTTWIGSASYVAAGAKNYAAVLTPSDYLSIANNPFLSNTENLYISFDYMTDDWTAWNFVLDKAFQYTFSLSAGNFSFKVETINGTCDIFTYGAAIDNNWHNYRLLYDGEKIAVLVDNVLAGSLLCSSKIIFSSAPLTFSSYLGNNGKIDNIQIKSYIGYTAIKWPFFSIWWIVIGLIILIKI